ncbi:aminotransferase-like domain-containing protein [Bosea thiooxidans]
MRSERASGAQHRVFAEFGAVLDRGDPKPLHDQLYDLVRKAIVDGVLSRGTRLPSSRFCTDILGVSRNTVLWVFQELLAEGYLEARRGSGTFVAFDTPNARRLPRQTAAAGRMRWTIPPAFALPPSVLPFRPNVPALDLFPWRLWIRLARQALEKLEADPGRLLLGQCEPLGHVPLRQSVADYLRATKGFQCSAENVVIFAGPQQALDVTSRVITRPGTPVWLEDPTPPRVLTTLEACYADVSPIPTGRAGFDVDSALSICPSAQVAYVMPAKKHIPLGEGMNLARRRQLIDVVSSRSGWIVEDDQSDDFLDPPHALPPLFALDRTGSSIYLGSFHRVLFPSLCFAYAVVPDRLIEAFVRQRAIAGGSAPLIEQMVINSFIKDGHLDQHLSRMRKVYAERHECLVEAARRYVPDQLEIVSSTSSIHLAATFKKPVDDVAFTAMAAANQLDLSPLSPFSRTGNVRSGLLMGFSAYDPILIERGMRQLGSLLHA